MVRWGSDHRREGHSLHAGEVDGHAGRLAVGAVVALPLRRHLCAQQEAVPQPTSPPPMCLSISGGGTRTLGFTRGVCVR
jgi:hypothetical protein